MCARKKENKLKKNPVTALFWYLGIQLILFFGSNWPASCKRTGFLKGLFDVLWAYRRKGLSLYNNAVEVREPNELQHEFQVRFLLISSLVKFLKKGGNLPESRLVHLPEKLPLVQK